MRIPFEEINECVVQRSNLLLHIALRHLFFLFLSKRLIRCFPEFTQNSFNLCCSSNQFFDICERSHHAELLDLWPQSGQEPPLLLYVLYLAFPKQFVQAFEIFLNLSLGSCLMASIFIRMSSASTFLYFCSINIRS